MTEEKKGVVKMNEFEEIEIVEEKEKRSDWKRVENVKAYKIFEDKEQGVEIYENQRGGERILVKVFKNVVYVIKEVRE